MLSRLLLALSMLCAAPPAAAQSILVPADSRGSTNAPKAARADVMALVGILDIIPMGGAQVVLRSNNYGQITLLPQLELPKGDLSRIERWVEQREQVQVRGTMLTVCSERELKQDIMGCRVMDRTKPMTLRKQ